MVTSSSENADSISLSASTATAVAREAERSAARAAKRREEKEQKESTRPVAHVGHLPFYLEVKKGALAGAGQTSEEHNHVKKDAMEFTKHINEAGKLADKLNIDMTCIVSQTVQGQFKIVATAGNAKNDILTVLQMDQCDPLTHLLGRTQDLVRGQMTSDKFWVAKLDNEMLRPESGRQMIGHFIELSRVSCRFCCCTRCWDLVTATVFPADSTDVIMV